MGNRAVIQFGDDEDAMGIYLHWNGGIESVKAFLDYAKEKDVRTDDYGVARLAQIIGNFFGGTLSVGVGLARTLDRDNYDNGTYIVKDWKIDSRLHAHDPAVFAPEYYDTVLKRVRETNDQHFTSEGESMNKSTCIYCHLPIEDDGVVLIDSTGGDACGMPLDSGYSDHGHCTGFVADEPDNPNVCGTCLCHRDDHPFLEASQQYVGADQGERAWEHAI